MNLQEELKASKVRIAELEERVEQEKEFPQVEDDYWYVNGDAETMLAVWYGDDYDKGRLSIDNVFKTRNQVDFVAEKLKVEAELRKFSRPFEYGKFNYCLLFDIDGNNFRTDVTSYCPSQGAIYFESEEKAQEAVSTVGEERVKKYIFGVEDL